MEDKKYRCPRCGSREEIIEYDESIGCMNCGLEFDKRDLDKFDEEDILARSEKQGIIKVLRNEFQKD